MNKKQLIAAWVLVSVFTMSGCITSSVKSPHITETSLAWYAYPGKKNLEDKALKKEYRKKIERYLLNHPQISKEIANKMRHCRVVLGMTEEEVLTMVKPNRILKAWGHKKIFRYYDTGKFGWTKFIGEGIKIRITLRDGVVTDISEIDTFMGA